MAQITVFGYVTDDLVPKQSQRNVAYVCFHVKEHIGKGRCQTYQVWAWGNDVTRMTQLGIKNGSLIWLSGSLELVDCTENQGRERTKILKVYCKDFGFLPGRKIARQDMQQNRGIPPVSPPPIPEILDGDRMPLPD